MGDSHLGGRKLVEGDVTEENFARAEEVFCTGTATVISPIEHVGENVEGSTFKYDYKPMREQDNISNVLLQLSTFKWLNFQKTAYQWHYSPAF